VNDQQALTGTDGSLFGKRIVDGVDIGVGEKLKPVPFKSLSISRLCPFMRHGNLIAKLMTIQKY
jgi:hypothetical protein